MFPLDLSRTLPAGGGLLLPYSLSGSPAIKQLMQMVTMVPGQGGRFQSVCFPLPTTNLIRQDLRIMKKGWEEREILCVIGKLWSSLVGYQTLVLFIIFELLLSTCKLNWILPSCTFCNSLPNSRFLTFPPVSGTDLQNKVSNCSSTFPTWCHWESKPVCPIPYWNSRLSCKLKTSNLHAWSCCCVGHLGSLLQAPHLLCSVLENNHDCGTDVCAITKDIKTGNQEIHQIATIVHTILSKDSSSWTFRNLN